MSEQNDLISRQAAIGALGKAAMSYSSLFSDWMMTYQEALKDGVDAIEKLPPAQPQRMHGRWINLDDVERDLGATCFAKRTDDGELIALCSLDVYADMREESNE